MPTMLEAAKYSAMERLRDGRMAEIRALSPEDERGMLAAVDHTSSQSMYRRFFGAKREFSEKERAFFLKVDFVALVAVVKVAGAPEIAAGGRYIVERPGAAEIAFIVTDDYQGLGIGTALLRHLAILAREAGLKEFTAEVLPENIPMLNTFKKSGLKMSTKRESGAVHVSLEL